MDLSAALAAPSDGALALVAANGIAWSALLLLAIGAAMLGLALRARRRTRARRRGLDDLAGGAAGAQAAQICPACRREYAPGTMFCPHDAQRLEEASGASAAPRGPQMQCPRCRRAWAAGNRYCVVDAEELVPAALTGGEEVPHAHPLPRDGSDKICPTCAARYSLETTFCGRDGSELAPVN